MIKKNLIAVPVVERLPQVKTYFAERRDVVFSYLFGSVASGRTHPLSDVDVAVYLEGSDISEKRLEILGDLSNILKTDEIDLIILNTAHLTLKMKVLQSRYVLSDNQPLKRHLFESLTIRCYLDFSKLQKRILERRFLHG